MPSRPPQHGKKTRNSNRSAAGKLVYGVQHRKLRLLCFERDEWRCVDCGWEPELVRIFRQTGLGIPPIEQILDELRKSYNEGDRHLHAEHELRIEERPDLRLDLENLKTRCNVCHNLKTSNEMRAGGGYAKYL